MLSCSLKKSDIAGAQRSLSNDLEGPIGRLRPELLKLKEKLEDFQPEGVCFSGSGPSIFALTRDRAEAEGIAAHFRRTYTQVFVVTTD
jgi:4-diphosphocytidyl-2-C-methyl-D-erythritol kinase